MKRFVLILTTLVFAQTLCYAVEVSSSDSVKVEYQIYGNDTIYYNTYYQFEETVFCGLKQYEESLFSKFYKQYNRICIVDLIDEIRCDNENRVAFMKCVVRKVLDGYGKERCVELMNKVAGKRIAIQILISVDVEGRVFDLDFMYTADYAEFMTNEDIVRNTKILKDGEPFLYFTDYAKMGVRILPQLNIPIDKCFIESFLKNDVADETNME